MSEPRLRLFVAAELPRGVRRRLAAWGRAAAAADPALRALDAPALHVTLAFLGPRPAAETDALGAVVDGVAAGAGGPVRLRLAGTLWLAPRRPQVLSAALDDEDGALRALHAVLLPALAGVAAGWEPERRPLRPHVTVARVRRGERPEVESAPPAPTAAFAVPALVLYRSLPSPRGSRYEALARAPLPGG